MRTVQAFTLGRRHPSARLRIEAFRPALEAHGWRWRRHAFHHGMGRSWPRSRPEWWRYRLTQAWHENLVRFKLKQLGARPILLVSRELSINPTDLLAAPNSLILDIDDGLYLGPGKAQVLAICQRAELVVCGNEEIKKALTPFSQRCEIVPTVMDCSLYRVAGPPRKNGRLRVGWLGSCLSVGPTLGAWAPTLLWLRSQLDFEWVTIVDGSPNFLQGYAWATHVPWSLHEEKRLADHIDVGVMPLQDDEFQAAKCGAKLLQYMASGLPVVATPLGANSSIVVDGVTGYLASTPEDWLKALSDLSASPQSRQQMGQLGRERVEKLYSTQTWEPVWLDLLESLRR